MDVLPVVQVIIRSMRRRCLAAETETIRSVASQPCVLPRVHRAPISVTGNGVAERLDFVGVWLAEHWRVFLEVLITSDKRLTADFERVISQDLLCRARLKLGVDWNVPVEIWILREEHPVLETVIQVLLLVRNQTLPLELD